MKLHRTALIAFAALAITGTAQAADTFTLNGGQVIVHTVDQPRGRVILLHGFTGTSAFVTAVPQDQLLAGLLADRWQVVAPDLPFAGLTMPTDLGAMFTSDPTGAAYLVMWADGFEAIAAELDRRYGSLPLVVGGISWGGYNALQAACHSSREVAWFAQAPVVDPARLWELSTFGPLPSAQLGSCMSALRETNGLISHNLLDTRVGVEPTRALADSLAGPRFTEQVFPDLAHVTTSATNDGVLAWVRGLLPAPVVAPPPVEPPPPPATDPAVIERLAALEATVVSLQAAIEASWNALVAAYEAGQPPWEAALAARSAAMNALYGLG